MRVRYKSAVYLYIIDNTVKVSVQMPTIEVDLHVNRPFYLHLHVNKNWVYTRQYNLLCKY